MPTEINNGTAQDNRFENQLSVNDVIGKVPGRFLYSGITMIFLVTVCILVMAYFFKYPDKLVSQGILTSKSPPIELLSQTNGYIDTILIKNKQVVKRGDEILRIHNTTNTKELKELEQWIQQYQKISDPRNFLRQTFPENLQLGILQGDYAQMQLKFNELQQTLKDGVVFEQMSNIDREIEKIKSLSASQRREKRIFQLELDLAKKDDLRQASLLKEGIISELEYEKVKLSTLQLERQYESMENGIIQNNIKIEQLSLEKLKLKEQRATLVQNYQFSIDEIISRINYGIDQWTNTYTVKATESGTVFFIGNKIEKTNVQSGQALLYILPSVSDSIYASVMFPTTNFGKIEKGQKAIIKLDAYPYKEYGIIETKVGDFALLPQADKEGNRSYEVKFLLKDQIKTDYDEIIEYRPNLTCTAEIITEDKSVLERIFNQFLSLINQSV